MKKHMHISRSIISYVIVTFLALLFLPGSLYAQKKITGEISKAYQITLNDGSTVSGTLTSLSDTDIVIQSESLGEVRLQKENIKSMTEISSINAKKSGIWFPNPNSTRYLIGSSAIPGEKKTGYYQNTWVFVNSFNYCFTNFLSVSAGFEIISIMAGKNGPYAFYINPKASFKVAKNFYLGGNILYANTIRSIDEFGGLGTLNAFGTYGNNNINITGAVGWGWSDGTFSSSPLITISGMARASKRIAFVSENWLIPKIGDTEGYYGVFSYGIRFLGEKTSIDLAFINNPDIADAIIIGIPWLDFVIKF
jgi:hypothetical protein